jgi:hypothetical protein
MNESLLYRAYREGDEHGILELFKEVFGHDLTLPFWEWKYRLAPGGGPRVAIAQEPGGKIVAAYNVISLPALIRSQEGVMGQCVDIMVHPRHRGKFLRQGVLIKTFSCFCQAYKSKEIHFLYGFPGKRHWILGQRTRIYYGGGQISFFKRSPRRQRLLTRLLFSFKPLEESLISVVDELWEFNKGQYKTGIVRDSDYLRWRFLNHPNWSYSLFILSKRGGRAVGWCALKHDGEEMLLVDFMVPLGFFACLLEKVEEIAVLFGSKAVSVAVPEETVWAKEIFSLGYQNNPTDLHFTTSFMGSPPSWADGQVKEVFYTMGDMDII